MDVRSLKQHVMTRHILEKKRTLLNVSIRLGKTKIALDAIEPFEKVLVVYPYVSIYKSWQDDIEKFPPLSSDITFTTTRSLKKHVDTTWDYVIVDEPQELSPKQILCLKTIKSKKLVGLSGTLSSKTVNELRDTLNWHVGITYTIADAIADKLVKDYRIFIHRINLDNVQQFEYKRYGHTTVGNEAQIYKYYSDTMDYFKAKQEEEPGDFRLIAGWKKYMNLRTNLIYNSHALLDYTQRLVKNYEHKKALIYTTRTEIADKLSSFTFHSKNKNDEMLEEFKDAAEGHAAVVNAVKAGITIKKLNTVIFHSYESNTETFFQKLGRSLLYEYEGEVSTIHLICLKGTQMEDWANEACASLEQEKIFYYIDGQIVPKLEYHKEQHPDKQLFLFKGKLVYFNGRNEEGVDMFSFLGKPSDKTYPMSRKNLIAV